MVRREYRIEHRMTLDVTVRVDDKIVDRGWALNEASIENMSRLGVLEVVLEVDGRPVSSFGCDGVLVATPTGFDRLRVLCGRSGGVAGTRGTAGDPEQRTRAVRAPAGDESRIADRGRDSRGGHDGLVFCDGRRTLELPAGGRVDVVRGQAPGALGTAGFGTVRRPDGAKVRTAGQGLAGKEALRVLAEIRIDNLGVISEASAAVPRRSDGAHR